MSRNIIKILLSFLIVAMLISIRYYESFFYDPLRDFFNQAYLHKDLPKINQPVFWAHILIRYALNSLLSVLIIRILFNKVDYIKFSLFFYGIAFVFLLVIFWLLIHTYQTHYYLPLFYIRRFLIQPIFLLLLLPAFYFQQIQTAHK